MYDPEELPSETHWDKAGDESVPLSLVLLRLTMTVLVRGLKTEVLQGMEEEGDSAMGLSEHLQSSVQCWPSSQSGLAQTEVIICLHDVGLVMFLAK